MKSFKSIREGNSVEPGVSEIDDVPEDPMSYVEIKPKKTKVVKEGIVDTAANAKVRIFSSIDRKKKELYKNAVKEDIQEAITVKKEKYSWGKMMTVHHGSDTSYPLHPEHQQAIAKLGDGEKTSFKDETNSSVHAEREGDTVHLTRPRTSSTKTSVAHSHFTEEVEQGVAEAAKWRTQPNAHDLDTDGSYIPKGGIKSDNLATRQKASKTQSEKDPKSMAGMFGAKYAKKHGVPTKQLMKNIPLDAKKKEQGVAEGSVDKKPYPKTWHDVDPKIGKLVDKMSPEEKVKKGYSNPSILKKKKEQGVAEENLTELKKSTLGSYIKKASDSATMSAYGAGGESQRHAGEPVSKRPDTYGADRKVALKRLKGIGKASDRLTKEEAELKEGIKSKIAGMALSALAAHGAAHGRVTFDDQGGHSGGYKPTATATATSTPSDNKPAAETPSGLSKEYLQRAADPNRFGRHMHLISPEKAAEHLKKMKEDKKQVVETKGAPKGFHFTKSGELKRGDADQDGNGGPMLRTDPLDKQRNKVPAVSEGIDFFKVWESIKPEEVVVEEEKVDPVVLKKEADRIMELNIAARKAK